MANTLWPPTCVPCCMCMQMLLRYIGFVPFYVRACRLEEILFAVFDAALLFFLIYLKRKKTKKKKQKKKDGEKEEEEEEKKKRSKRVLCDKKKKKSVSCV